MARKYMIFSGLSGTDLQITGDDIPEEHHALQTASGHRQRREAEEIINGRFYSWEPFPGFDWQRMGSEGWYATDHDLKPA